MSDKNNKRKQRAVSEKSRSSQARLDDLEPPKIYRQDQVSSRQTKTQTRRRQNKKRRLKNSVRRALIIAAFAIALAAAGTAVCITAFCKVETVTAAGSEMYSQQQIVDASGISSAVNLVLLDKEETAAKIERSLPYIGSVDIKKVFPNTVEITAQDTRAAYSVENTNGTYTLLAPDFKVLEGASAQNPADTVIISNAQIKSAQNGLQAEFADTAQQERLSAIAKAIENANMTQATELYSKSVNENYVVYMGRITFILGTVDNIDEKILRGLASCERIDESGSNISGTLDLTVDKQSYFTAE